MQSLRPTFDEGEDDEIRRIQGHCHLNCHTMKLMLVDKYSWKPADSRFLYLFEFNEIEK
jgi:hypothetical protein